MGVTSQDLFSYPQVIGYIALVIYVGAYCFKRDNTLKILFSVSNIFWIAHYYLIGAETAALTTALITLRNILALNAEDFSRRRKIITAGIFTGLLLTAGIVTWNGPVSIIPVATTIAVTFAMLYLKGIRLRQLLLAVDSAWLLHAVIVLSIPGAIYAISAIVMNLITILKMKKSFAR